MLALVGLFVMALAIVVWLGYRRSWDWTGLPARPIANAAAGQPAKTLWDWLQLLVVPLVLAVAVFALSHAQATRSDERDATRERGEARSAADHAREETLRNYLEQMTDLVLQHKLRESPPPNRRATDVQALARTLTLTALRRLDGERKALVLQFLWEAGLITQSHRWTESRSGDISVRQVQYPRVSLDGSDLRGVTMRERHLAPDDAPTEATLVTDPATGISRQSRTGADLSGADLRKADFRSANLGNAWFENVDLRNADLSEAVLGGTSFASSCLDGSIFRSAKLAADDFTPRVSFAFVEGRNVDFSDAALDGADFSQSLLTNVAMDGASIRGTEFPTGWTGTGNPGGFRYAGNPCHREGR